MKDKRKLTHEEELAKRIWKKPWPPIYLLYYLINKLFVQPAMKIKVIKKDKLPKKGPAIIIYNHMSRLDHSFFLEAAWPRRINILASYIEFFRKHLHTVFKLNKVIPKKIYTTDIISLKAMKKILKEEKGIVVFSPEGTPSFHGNGQPIVPGTAHFLKHYGVPVYSLDIKGSYLVQNKVDNDIKKGPVECTLELMFSPEDLKNLSEDVITDRINEKMRHDDFEWQKSKHYLYKPKRGVEMTKNLSHILYRCPKCNSLFTTIDEGDKLYCTECGSGITMNHYYEIQPLNNHSVIFDTPTKWCDFERMEVIKEIRRDENFSFECHAILGGIPKYEWIPKTMTSKSIGDGRFRVDHTGVSYEGSSEGKPYSFHLNYNEIYSPALDTDMRQFHFFVKGEFHEFTPDNPQYTDYIIHLIQEMHRLHVNQYKNFKWNEYMYNIEE